MTTTFEYAKPNDNYSNLSQVTLSQGLKFKKSQNKIKQRGKKNIIESFQSNLEEGQSGEAIAKTSQLINQTDNMVINKMNELKNLQKQFNSVLKQYNQANSSLLSATQNYLNQPNTSNSPGLLSNVNVFVNSMLNGATTKMINTFSDNTSSPAMTMLDGNYTFDTCKTSAENQGYKYFGLENANTTTQNSLCGVSNSESEYSKNGAYVPRCKQGSDGNMYGGAWTNALYQSVGNYIGCFGDGSNRAMTASGPDMGKYNNVYVCGAFGIGPWGSSNFPDPTAQWIWYTPNAQNNAPDNTNAPVNFIYQYNYGGNSYITADLWGMCDNQGTVYLNSNAIGSISGGWGGQGKKLSITLAPGSNYIEVAAANQGGPAGLLLAVTYGGAVLFHTDGSWKYTSESLSDLRPGAQEYSVSSCKDYAVRNGYSYFGLQNGTNGNSQCFISNDLNSSQKYGSADGETRLNDGNIYGLNNNITVYELDKVGVKDNMGKVGYINENSEISEYPQSMYTLDSATNTPSILNNASCPKSIQNIDTVEWDQYKNLGGMMTADTLCGLDKETQNQQISKESLQSQLSNLADEIVNKITYLESLNLNLNNQMVIDQSVLDDNLKKYKALSLKYKNYKTTKMPNINGILSDSDIIVLQENYSYLFWSIIAIATVVITINTIKKNK